MVKSKVRKKPTRYWEKMRVIKFPHVVSVSAELTGNVIMELEEDKVYSPRDESLFDPWLQLQ